MPALLLAEIGRPRMTALPQRKMASGFLAGGGFIQGIIYLRDVGGFKPAPTFILIYSRTPTCPPKARANSAAPTTRPTMITATTVAFSNSAPAAKSHINRESVRDFADPSNTTVLISRAAEINPTSPTVISAGIARGRITRLKV